MFELLPGSHLEIAKDKYNTQPTIFFLQTNIVTYNNSLVPGGDKRPCILRETWKPEVCFNIYDLTLPTSTSCKLKYSNPFCAHFLKKFHGFYNLTAHPKPDLGFVMKIKWMVSIWTVGKEKALNFNKTVQKRLINISQTHSGIPS